MSGESRESREIRAKSVNGRPKAGEFMRGCNRCDASFGLLDSRAGDGQRGIWGSGFGLRWWCSQECHDLDQPTPTLPVRPVDGGNP